jgi:uncharacterized membrane protein
MLVKLAFILLFIDFIYIFLSRNYFSKQILEIQKYSMKINYFATFLCYMLLIFGLYYFIIKPKRTIIDAFLLGFVIYGVFETTNKALFSKWNWKTVIMDTLWGGILFAIVTYIIYNV